MATQDPGFRRHPGRGGNAWRHAGGAGVGSDSQGPGAAMSSEARTLKALLDEAEAKAWVSLARYRFQMFGYWAAIWVHLNRIGGFGRSNPWASLVSDAKAHVHQNLQMGAGRPRGWTVSTV